MKPGLIRLNFDSNLAVMGNDPTLLWQYIVADSWEKAVPTLMNKVLCPV
jgi:hypothetical protein